jgi:hypothetical protein
MQWIIYFVLRFTAHSFAYVSMYFFSIFDGIYSQTALLLGSFFWVIFRTLFWHFACVCHWHLEVIFLGGWPGFTLLLACFSLSRMLCALERRWIPKNPLFTLFISLCLRHIAWD